MKRKNQDNREGSKSGNDIRSILEQKRSKGPKDKDKIRSLEDLDVNHQDKIAEQYVQFWPGVQYDALIIEKGDVNVEIIYQTERPKNLYDAILDMTADLGFDEALRKNYSFKNPLYDRLAYELKPVMEEEMDEELNNELRKVAKAVNDYYES